MDSHNDFQQPSAAQENTQDDSPSWEQATKDKIDDIERLLEEVEADVNNHGLSQPTPFKTIKENLNKLRNALNQSSQGGCNTAPEPQTPQMPDSDCRDKDSSFLQRLFSNRRPPDNISEKGNTTPDNAGQQTQEKNKDDLGIAIQEQRKTPEPCFLALLTSVGALNGWEQNEDKDKDKDNIRALASNTRQFCLKRGSVMPPEIRKLPSLPDSKDGEDLCIACFTLTCSPDGVNDTTSLQYMLEDANKIELMGKKDPQDADLLNLEFRQS